jgi:hypothetical protein
MGQHFSGCVTKSAVVGGVRFQEDIYCVPNSLLSLMPNATQCHRQLLKSACDERATTKGHIRLSIFRSILLEKQAQIGIAIKRCELRRHEVKQISAYGGMSGGPTYAVVSNGSGHAFGLHFASSMLVDPHPDTPYPITIVQSPTLILARYLGRRPDEKVNVLYMTI